MKRKEILLEFTAFSLTLCLLAGVTAYLGYLYIPSRQDYGATWNMYLEEQEDSVDLLIVGSSLAYCDIIPGVIYEQTGHTSYVMAAPYMKPDVAYYYLKEALRTQSPDVVMLEATSFFFCDREADYYKVNIGYMPWGRNRLEAVFHAPSQYWLGLLFPLYNYHERWTEYSLSDYVAPRPDAHTDLLAGYTLLNTARPQQQLQPRVFQATLPELEENFSWLTRIRELCQQEGIRLELFIAPSCEYISQGDLARLYAAADGVTVTDFNQQFEAIALNLSTDFYDSRHLNFHGAKKFSQYLSEYVEQNFTLTGSRHDQQLWQRRVAYLYEQ